MPTRAAPLPRAIPWPAAIETRRPVNEPGPVATATRVTAESAVRVESRIRSIAGKSSSPCRRWARQVSSPRTSRPSKSATDAQSVDVSSASNTAVQLLYEARRPRTGRRDDDAPLRIGDVFEAHIEPVVGQRVAGSIGPFDHRHAAGLEALLPAGVGDVRAFEAIKVHVEERQSPTAVLAKDDERRARDIRRIDAESRGYPAGEHRLSRAELAPQREDVVRSRRAAQTLAEAFGVER